MNPSRTHSRSNSQSPSTGYPSFDLYPDHPTHSPSIQPYASAASTGIAAVGGALVGAMMRGAAAGLRSGVGAATHVTHTLAGPSRKLAPASKPPPPSTPASDSNTSTPVLPNSPSERRRWEAKVDQIIHRFYIKTAQVIVDSRLEPSPDQGQFDRVGKLSGSARSSTSIGKPTTFNSSERQMKRDKWFNLELEDPDYFRDELRTWKTASSLLFNPLSTSSPSLSISQQKPNFDSIPVMIFETILDLQSLPSNSILILKDFNGQDIRLNHTSFTPGSSPNPPPNQNIVLERWTVSMASPMPVLPGPELPTVYRYCIVHFRALYSLCRTLPAWPLFKRLKKPGSREHDILKIGCRLSSASGADELERLQQGLNRMSFTDEIAIDQRLSDAEPHNHLGSFRFPTVQTPYGMLQSDVRYRTQVEFYISDREAALSSRFMDEDYFLSPDNINPPHRFAADHQRSGYSVPNPVKTLSASPEPQDEQSMATTRFKNVLTKPSYGSLSSRHPLHRRSNSTQEDLVGSGGNSASSSLTAAIRAAAESSAFTSSPPLPPTRHLPSTQVSNSNGNSSALTAKLVAKRQSLPPVLSNALPTGLNRAYTARPPSASPRQTPSMLSSSPLSGPSSSIRMSSNQQPPSPLSPSAVTVGPRPMPTAPMTRRYSSSRTNSRSYGQTSLESSSLSRRALLNSSSEHSHSTSNDAGDINTFLAMLDSRPSLKRVHQPHKQPSILSRSQAEMTMKRLAGSVQGSSTSASVSQVPTSRGPSQSSGSGSVGKVLQGLLEEEEEPSSVAYRSSYPTPARYSPAHRRQPSQRTSGSYPDLDDGEVVGKLELGFGPPERPTT